ncbi:MAG: YicC family protein [candidate division KSB1 bacterium]|nr:YicC family protein [candidate division KSB1 bacterium]MDZ7346749.1 YicC family protein [candidate division KSB1 bacterium]
MIASMTGYGRGSSVVDECEIVVEVRSVNNRFLDIVLKAPVILNSYENQIRELVGNFLSRGRVSIVVTAKNGGEIGQKTTLNHAMVAGYVAAAEEIRCKYSIGGSLDLAALLSLPNVIEIETESEKGGQIWECTRSALEEALLQVKSMRFREGKELRKDFEKRLDAMGQIVRRIEALAKDAPMVKFERLSERISRFFPDEKVDQDRLEMELAVIADRIDITEELTRFDSHLAHFRELLDAETSQGRKLNFLLQEMNREANTMSSKSYSAEIAHLVVEIKEEIEKLREQVQNIE